MEMGIDSGDDIDRMIAKMNRLPELMARRVQGDGLLAAARVVRDEAKNLVPVLTGQLRSSIRVRRRAQTVETFTGKRRIPGGAARVQAGGAGARQALLVEYGHGGPHPAPPHPYLEPAISGTRSLQFKAAVAAMRRSLVAALKLESG